MLRSEAFRVHLLTVLAVMAGIFGMGLVFEGAMAGNFMELSRGMPFLMIGLWWSSRQLGRSMSSRR